MNKEVLLFTCGVDSWIAREYLFRHGHDIDCLYFDHGGRYASNEISKIKSYPFPVIINNSLSFKDIEKPDAFIPNRNIMLAIAANSLGYDKIWIGGSMSDRVCDNNEQVFQKLSEFLTTMNGRYIKIDSPFWNCYKDDMVKWYYNDVASQINLINYTFSCYNPVLMHDETAIIHTNNFIDYSTEECLNCSACFRKCAALYSAGIFINFMNRSVVDKYYTEFRTDLVQTTRSIQTLKYIDQWYLNRIINE